MEIDTKVITTNEKSGLFRRIWLWFREFPAMVAAKVVELSRDTIKLGQDDPRRVIHSLKVGLALTLISLLYYYQPLYDSFGANAIWAVMTVVVVFEFSVGATIGKGLNRGLATLVAGALGVGAHELASLSGQIGEPILLGFFVFLQASSSTFIRFFPTIKARYDYGMLVFILTFCLISVSGFHADEILEMAHKRLSTIIIGGSACIIISLLVCPVWAGQDLHNLISLNMEKLANFLEGFGGEYFKTQEDEETKDEKPLLQGYKSVLNSKSNEEALANFARWEPGHGQFRFRHPWKQYLKIGTLTCECAYRIEALNGYLNADIQASPEIRSKIQDECTKLSMESGNALKQLAVAVKTMNEPSTASAHIGNAQISAKNLKALFKSGLWEESNLLAVIPVATVASLLIDIVECIKKLAESVQELASLAHFEHNLLREADCPQHVVITITESSPVIVEHGKSNV